MPRGIRIAHHCTTQLVLASLVLVFASRGAAQTDEKESAPLIGFTKLKTNLPGGRHANVRTSRAFLVQVDGSGLRHVLTTEPRDENTWTQFAGWSPDGRQVIINEGWQSPENARWEEKHRRFRIEPGKWRLDSLLVDLETRRSRNLTAIDRVSHYNGGLFFYPDGKTLGFTPLIRGVSKPWAMDLDGRSKRDVSGDGQGFAYGYSVSPDGEKLSYHESYQIWIADKDGSNRRQIDTGQAFNFAPKWSPDGKWLLFVSGARGQSNPWVVRRDGSGLRKLADLGGYQGWILFLDVDDFHEGSSDVPTWSRDGSSVFYTAKIDERVELFQIDLEGKIERLTKTDRGTLHYHPTPSPDGRYIAYGSKRDGVRQLFVLELESKRERQLTKLSRGEAAMWPHWQPKPKK